MLNGPMKVLQPISQMHRLGKDDASLLIFVTHGMSQGLQDLHFDHMALTHRQSGEGLLHHSDRESQYTSAGYQRLLAMQGIHVCGFYENGSMTQAGTPRQVEHVT